MGDSLYLATARNNNLHNKALKVPANQQAHSATLLSELKVIFNRNHYQMVLRLYLVRSVSSPAQKIFYKSLVYLIDTNKQHIYCKQSHSVKQHQCRGSKHNTEKVKILKLIWTTKSSVFSTTFLFREIIQNFLASVL